MGKKVKQERKEAQTAPSKKERVEPADSVTVAQKKANEVKI